MTNIETIANFEREINKLDDAVNKPATEDSLFWLNQAIAKFTKLRFNGDLIHKTGYEETEKRREDLILLFKQQDWKNLQQEQDENPSYARFSITYPMIFFMLLMKML